MNINLTQLLNIITEKDDNEQEVISYTLALVVSTRQQGQE